ncbi:MAG: Bax inhibitor-1/YccA family protein [Campylobacteraceae bacterium]|jgi:modulator of FtsH protease|nr:Bax inhibitor-1/YccA family protein [Campylobacteraceae bacterium]
MALYDRDYTNEQVQSSELGYAQSKSALSLFIKKTYQLFAASLLAGSVGAYIGMDFIYQLVQYKWVLFGTEIALLIALIFAKRKAGLNYVLLFAFTFMSGLTLAPFLGYFLQTPAGTAIVVNAFILTTVAFGGLSVFAMNTKRNFGSLGKFLLTSLIVLIAALIIEQFTSNPFFYTVVSAAGAILFSIYVLYDTQNIIKGAYETPIEGAIALYLDFFNLFLFILRLLGIFSSDE